MIRIKNINVIHAKIKCIFKDLLVIIFLLHTHYVTRQGDLQTKNDFIF